MAIPISLFSKWLLILVLFQLICTIGLSVSSEDDDLSISSSKLTGSLEDLKSDFSFESEGQSPAGSLNSNLKTSEELKLKKNGNLLENDEYIIQDDESEDDGYIVQDDELEDEYIVQDDESEGDGYNVQDDNDLLELQSKISSKSTSNVQTPDDNRAQNIKPFDDSNGIPTGRKDVYHYGNASPKTQNSGKHTEATSSSDDGKTDGVDATLSPKKSKLSTWEKAQLMMMKRNKNKMEKETQQKGDEIIVGSPFISLDAKASSSVSEKSLDVKHSDSSPPRNESSEDIDLPQSGKLSSNDVVVEDLAIEESREKFIKHPVSVAQEDRHESVITTDSSDDDVLKSDIDNNLESRRDKDKEMPHQDQDSKKSDSKVSLTEESNQSKIIALGKNEGDGTIDHKAGDGISEGNIDSSQGNDEDQDTDDAGGQESDGIDIESESISDLENVKEVKNEIHAVENRDSLDSKLLPSSKDENLKDEIVNSSNNVEVKNEIHAAENRDSLDSKLLPSSKDDFKDEIVNSSNSVEIKNEIHAAENRDSKVLSSSKDDFKDEIVTSSNSMEVKNEIHAAENRDSLDGKVLSSFKDDFKDEIANSSNGEEGSARNLTNESISDVKDVAPKSTTYVEKSAVEEVNITSDVLTREELKVDLQHIYPDDGTSDVDITANDTDGDQANNTKDMDRVETDDHGDNNKGKNKDGSENETLGRDDVSTAGNALFDEDALNSQTESPDDHSVIDQTNLVDKGDAFENMEDEQDIKEDSEKDAEESNKDSHSSDSVHDIKNSSVLSKDVYDGNDIKQVNESGAKEGPVKEESKKDDDEGTQMSESLIRDVSDSDKSDGKEMGENTKDIEIKEDNMDIVEDNDEKPKDAEESNKDSHSSDSVHDIKNSSGLSKDVYDGNDIKQVNESGAKEGPVKEESKKDDDEGTQMSESLIRDVSDSDKSDGKEMGENTKDIEIKEDNMDIVEDNDEIPKDAEESNKDSHSSDSVHDIKNSSGLSKDVYDGNDIKQVNESGAKEGPVKEESKKDDDEGTQMSESLIRDVSDSDKSDGKEMGENTKDIEIKEDNMDIVEDNDEKPKDAEESNKDSHSSDSVHDIKNSSGLSKDVYDGNDIKQVNESGAKEGPVKEESKKDDDEGTQMSESLIRDVSDSDKSDGKEMDENTKDIEIKEDNMDIVEDNDEKPKDAEGSEDEDTENDENVEAGEDTVEGTDEGQADNYMDEEDDVNVDENIEMDDEHVDNDAKEVEGNDENGSENADAKKLHVDPMDGYENHVNDDKNIEKVYRNAHKEGEVRDNVAKDGDEKINSKNADGNTRNMEVFRDKNDINEEKKQVVDKLPNSEDENVSGNNKNPKKEQVGDKKGPKDAGKDNENVEVSLDSKDDESGNETFNEPSKDDDGEISDVDDFEGIKKDDNGIDKNDEGIAKDDNNNDVNEKDSKTSIGSVVDTNEIVNKTSSNHTTVRNATNFEDIHSKKMQKDDSFGEGITDNKTLVNEDNQTSTSARASEDKMLNKDVIDGGDAPGLIFEDVPTYVEITRDHDEQGINANINDSTVNVDVDGDADGPIAFDPTPASSLEASPSSKDATTDSEEMPTEDHEKDSETSVKDINSEKLDVSIDKNVVDSLEETLHFETSTSQEADKESAKNKDFSNIVSEVDKDISNYIETTDTSNVEYEEVMPDSTVDTNEYEVHPNIADERKAISTPEAQEQVGSHELEIESLIESDKKNVDDIPQEPDVSTGQSFPSEHVKAKDESQSVKDDSDFSDIPSQIDNLKITTNVEDEKMTENERVVDNEKFRGASEDMTEAKDDGKIAEDEDVEANEKMLENLDVKDDGKMIDNLDVKADGKMVEDLDLKDEGNMEQDVEKYFQDTTLQSTKRDRVFFTIKPYISLLNTVMKKLDPFITGIIFMLPPSLQNIFLKAPFNMYPTHAFLLFILSCLSLFVISFSKIFKGNRQHSRSKELKEMLFETKGILLLSQVERDEAEQKLQDLKAKLKQKDDDLESGTAEMNKNLKALIKECDTLKEEVSRRMGSSKEMKGELKKAESDIQKQLLANKELQESITSAKSRMQKLQEKRDQLQSSIDESELNSMKLEEKIQCLSEDVEAVEESYDRLRTEVESNLKESGELQTTVDLLKKRCSKKSLDIETKEKENKILREAIMQLKIMKHLQEEDKNDDDDNDDGCDDDKKKEKLEERIKHLIYIAQTRIRMDEIEEQKESLKKSLTGAAEKKMDLNDELKITMEEMEKVEKLREDVERQATASTMKIDVLSDYYKQREKEYNKMLQEKEAKEKAISSQKKSANERYKEADKMVADYKNQVEVLNQELERIGLHYEKQMALQENKLQENLVFVKQTERDYNIKVKEAEIMRQKLLQYRERINLLESMMASHKSTETLNTSQTKEDIRPASRNLLLRENMPSPPNFMPPSFSPHPSSMGPIPPQFFNPPPFMMRHPFIPSRLPMRSREDSPTLQRIRDLPSDDFLDERDHYPTSRTRSPLRFGPSPACRNRSSPVDLKDKYTPLANNRPLDPFYMEKGDGSHRTKYNDK